LFLVVWVVLGFWVLGCLNVFGDGFCFLEGLSGLDSADFSHNVGLVVYGLGCHLGFKAYPSLVI